MSERRRWPELCSLVMVERERLIGTELSTTRAYFLSSLELSAERAGELVRGHWAIESGLHWVLDMVFDEDHSRIRDRTAAQSFALLRKLALALLKNEPVHARKSLVHKCRRAMMDTDYLFLVLAAVDKPTACAWVASLSNGHRRVRSNNAVERPPHAQALRPTSPSTLSPRQPTVAGTASGIPGAPAPPSGQLDAPATGVVAARCGWKRTMWLVQGLGTLVQ